MDLVIISKINAGITYNINNFMEELNNLPARNSKKSKIISFVRATALITVLIVGLGVISFWKSNKATLNTAGLYYYFNNYDPDSFSIYRFSSDISEIDQPLIINNQHLRIYGKYLGKNEILTSDKNNLYSTNVVTGEQEIIITSETGKIITGASVNSNKNQLVYSTTEGNGMEGTGEVWLYNLNTKETQRIFQRSLGIYAVLSVLGWNDDNSKIVTLEAAGDAGLVGGVLHLIDADAPYAATEIIVDESKEYFVRGKLSPDGRKWLYAHCATPLTSQSVPGSTCSAGEELFVYDFESSKHQSIYKNISHGDNISNDKLRIIFSSAWLDNDTVAFSNPDGIYKTSIISPQPVELYRFTWSSPEDINKNRTDVVLAGNKYVVFQRYGIYDGTFILDTKSKKVSEISQAVSGEAVNPAETIKGFIEL